MPRPLHRHPVSRTALAKSALIERIRQGEFKPGERIPPERALSGELGISRVLVGNMLRELARDGWLWRRMGSGTYVSENVPTPKTGIQRLGLVASNRGNPIAQRLLEGLHRSGGGEGCDVTVKDAHGDPREEQRAVRGLLDSGVQGLVVVTCFPYDSSDGLAFYEEVRRRAPIVLCDCEIPGDIPSVSTDNVRSGDLAGGYLARACSLEARFWILRGAHPFSSEINRVAGCDRRLRACGATRVRTLVLPPGPAVQKQTLVEALVEEVPGGVFLTSEVLLPPFFEALDASGRSRTGITLCCCDDFHSWASLYRVAHIEQPVREMATEALRELSIQARTPNGVVRHVCLAPRLVDVAATPGREACTPLVIG